jgi:hypothetical protein
MLKKFGTTAEAIVPSNRRSILKEGISKDSEGFRTRRFGEPIFLTTACWFESFGKKSSVGCDEKTANSPISHAKIRDTEIFVLFIFDLKMASKVIEILRLSEAFC